MAGRRCSSLRQGSSITFSVYFAYLVNHSVVPSTRNVAFIAVADQGIATPPAAQTTSELVLEDVRTNVLNGKEELANPAVISGANRTI